MIIIEGGKKNMDKKHILLKKVLVIGIIVLFISVSVIPITGSLLIKKQILINNEIPNISGNTRGNIYYVGGTGEGNYTKIQDAIDDTFPGDTVFVYDDSSPYYENIWINWSINLIGENKYTTQINGSGIDGKCVIVVWASNVTISNFNIENSGASPIYLDSGIYSDYHDCTYTNNIITYNKIGIYLNSRRNNISNNIIVDNRKQKGYGIYIGGGGNHNIFHNLISKSRYLIMMAGTSNNLICKNETIKIKYNSVEDYYIYPVINSIRLNSRQIEESVFSKYDYIERKKFNWLIDTSFKHMNFAQKSLLPGQRIIDTLFQKLYMVKRNIFFHLLFFKRYHNPHLSIITDKELVLIQGVKLIRDIDYIKYYTKRIFIPYMNLESIYVNKENNVIKYNLTLKNNLSVSVYISKDNTTAESFFIKLHKMIENDNYQASIMST